MKHPIPLAPGSRSVVLNPDFTLEIPERLLKILIVGLIPRESDLIAVGGTCALVFFNSSPSDPNVQPKLGAAAPDG